MDKAAATDLKNYQDALACSIAYPPTADLKHALEIHEKLVAASMKIAEHRGLENTQAYRDAVLSAEATARKSLG
jgi:hypothetical protein